MSRRKTSTRRSSPHRTPRSSAARPIQRESTEAFRSSRGGAWNIAGVNLQSWIGAAALLGLLEIEPISAVRPEGDEDLDLLNVSNEVVWHIQAKRRSGLVDQTTTLKAIEGLWSARRPGFSSRMAVVTNVGFAGEFASTKWGTSLWDLWTKPGLDPLEVASGIGLRPPSGSDLKSMLTSTHLVVEAVDAERVADAVRVRWEIESLVAELCAKEVFADIQRCSAENATKNPQTAAIVSISDFSNRILEVRALLSKDLLDAEMRGIVTPILSTANTSITRKQFLEGVSAQPEHIAAEYALPRTDAIQPLVESIRNNRSILLVGPSGAGKSTLLWQLAKCFEMYRQLRVTTQSSSDYGSITRLIQLLRPSKELPLLIVFDGLSRQGRTLWGKLIEHAQSIEGVAFAGTIREEEYDPSYNGDLVDVHEIARLDDREAMQVFNLLRESGSPHALEMNPTDLLREADGLMLEFIHLATTSRHLSTVLDKQAQHLLDHETPALAKVARIVCAADVCGLAISTHALRRLGIEDHELDKAISRLENEHVIRNSEGGNLRGLHPVRSGHLLNALHRHAPSLAETFASTIDLLGTGEEVRILLKYLPEHIDATELTSIEEAIARRINHDEVAPEWINAIFELEVVSNVRLLQQLPEVISEPYDSGFRLHAQIVGVRHAAMAGMSTILNTPFTSPAFQYTAERIIRLGQEQTPRYTLRKVRENVAFLLAVEPWEILTHRDDAQLLVSILEKLTDVRLPSEVADHIADHLVQSAALKFYRKKKAVEAMSLLALCGDTGAVAVTKRLGDLNARLKWATSGVIPLRDEPRLNEQEAEVFLEAYAPSATTDKDLGDEAQMDLRLIHPIVQELNMVNLRYVDAEGRDFTFTADETDNAGHTSSETGVHQRSLLSAEYLAWLDSPREMRSYTHWTQSFVKHANEFAQQQSEVLSLIVANRAIPRGLLESRYTLPQPPRGYSSSLHPPKDLNSVVRVCEGFLGALHLQRLGALDKSQFDAVLIANSLALAIVETQHVLWMKRQANPACFKAFQAILDVANAARILFEIRSGNRLQFPVPVPAHRNNPQKLVERLKAAESALTNTAAEKESQELRSVLDSSGTPYQLRRIGLAPVFGRRSLDSWLVVFETTESIVPFDCFSRLGQRAAWDSRIFVGHRVPNGEVGGSIFVATGEGWRNMNEFELQYLGLAGPSDLSASTAIKKINKTLRGFSFLSRLALADAVADIDIAVNDIMSRLSPEQFPVFEGLARMMMYDPAQYAREEYRYRRDNTDVGEFLREALRVQAVASSVTESE